MAGRGDLRRDLIDVLAKDTSAVLSDDDKKIQKAATLFLNKWSQFSLYLRQAQALNQAQEKVKNRVRNFKNVKGQDKTPAQLKMLYSKYGGQIYSDRAEKISTILNAQAPIFFKAAEDFQRVLFEVLGTKLIYTFIFQDQETGAPIIFELNNPFQLISNYQFNKDGQLVARFKQRSKTIIKKLNSLERVTPNRNDNAALDRTYNSVMYRWGRAKEKKTYRIMWKPKDHWMTMKIGSSGDLQEAYGAIIFTNAGAAANFNTTSLQEAVGLYMSFVEKIDNIWGGLQGDLSKNAKDWGDRTVDGKDRAIKTFNAQEMSLMPFITMARLIKQGKIKASNLDKIRQYFQAEGGPRNAIQVFQGKVDKTAEKMIEEQIKRVGWGQPSSSVEVL